MNIDIFINFVQISNQIYMLKRYDSASAAILSTF